MSVFDEIDEHKQSLRERFELYHTPKELIYPVFDKYNPHGVKVLEPACNTAPYCAIASEYGARTTTGLDVRNVESDCGEAVRADTFVEADFLTWETRRRFDMIVFNPPFSLTTKFVDKALSLLTKDGIAICLQRLELLGSQGRKEFWDRVGLIELMVSSRRYSFTQDDKTDRYNHGYFVFKNGSDWRPTISWF